MAASFSKNGAETRLAFLVVWTEPMNTHHPIENEIRFQIMPSVDRPLVSISAHTCVCECVCVSVCVCV